MSHLDVIEQFKRLPYDKQKALAEQFGLTDSEDRVIHGPNPLTNTWLLRAKESNILNEFGKAVQEAS